MKFTKNILMVLGLSLQFGIGFATDSSFITAARLGDLESVKIALDDPQININYQSPRVKGRNDIGPTALMLAAEKGHTEIVKLLLKAGADPSIKNVWGQTALQIAQQKDYKEIIQLIERYIKSRVDQLVHIMIRDSKHESPYNLSKERNPNDYQDVYNLVIKHPELMQGIIQDGRTFAMLCVERGYADLLARLINENCPIDLAKPCNMCGPHNPQTTVLHRLFSQVRSMSRFKNAFPEDYIAGITNLTKLIINKYPDLLDIEVDREQTAREFARFWEVSYLIPRK
jgi:hypothetical protein